MKILIVVSFISIAFVLAKLKFFKIVRTDSASTKWSFCVLPPPKYGSIIIEILTRGTIMDIIFWHFLILLETLFEKLLKDLSFYGKEMDPKLALLIQLWSSVSTEDGWNRNKWAVVQKNFSQICQNKGFISPLLSEKNMITICNIWAIIARKQGGITSQRVRIKIWQILFNPHYFLANFL